MVTVEEREKVLDLWTDEDRSASDVAKEVGTLSRSAVLGIVFRARREGDARAALRNRSWRASTRAALVEEAGARGLSLYQLKRRLIRNIARDGLVGAVLDDGR